MTKISKATTSNCLLAAWIVSLVSARCIKDQNCSQQAPLNTTCIKHVNFFLKIYSFRIHQISHIRAAINTKIKHLVLLSMLINQSCSIWFNKANLQWNLCNLYRCIPLNITNFVSLNMQAITSTPHHRPLRPFISVSYRFSVTTLRVPHYKIYNSYIGAPH
jgi:hypothetical protein